MHKFPVKDTWSFETDSTVKGRFIPWAMIAPHEAQALLNHGHSTLRELAERGGLSICEALAVLEDRTWTFIHADEARRKLDALVEEWSRDHPKEIRLDGADIGAAIKSMGQQENSVIVDGYNTRPYYALDNPSEPGAAWCIEPNYCPNPVNRPDQRCLEMYGQFQRVDGDQSTVRRPWMTRWDARSGEIDATEISAGPNGWVALCINDGTSTGGMTGSHKLTVTAQSAAVKILELREDAIGCALILEINGRKFSCVLEPEP